MTKKTETIKNKPHNRQKIIFNIFCSFPFNSYFLYIISMLCCVLCAVLSHSVVSNSLGHMNSSPPGSSDHGGSPGKNTGVACHALLQGIILTQELNQDLLYCGQILYQLSHQGNPILIYTTLKKVDSYHIIL